MNFFNVGFVLLSLHTNLDMILNYVLKIAGVFFMFAGINETETVSKGFKAARSQVWLIGVLSLGGLVCSMLIRYGILGGTAANIAAIVFGVGSAAAILYNQYTIVIKLMLPRHELVNDPSLLSALAKQWRIMAFFTSLCMVCDIMQRLLPQGMAQAIVGAVLVVSKIIMIIYVVLMGTAFNRVRMDFNVMHPV